MSKHAAQCGVCERPGEELPHPTALRAGHLLDTVVSGAVVTISQMCTCGERFEADSVTAVWQLLDEHCDAKHGPVFPRGAILLSAGPGRFARRTAPLTTQGGES